MTGTDETEIDRVMVDIETLGLEPGASIVSIGAVRFGPGELGETFQASISLTSCEQAGLSIDAETLEWWLAQDGEAKEQLVGGSRLENVLEDFTEWYGNADEIWANSPSFDCEVLEYAYEAVGLEAPWGFYEERDYRTLKSLDVTPEIEQDGVEHDALDDASHQAHVAAAALKRLNEPELVTDGGRSESAIPQKNWIETLLESLEMVQWDWFVQTEDDGLGVYFDIYGWIDRDEDAYKDFILLRVFPEAEDNIRMFTTSSDRYHDEINEILFGDSGESNHCQRVEHTFEVPNVVELDEPELATDGGTDRVTVEWDYGTFKQQHIRDANGSEDRPDGLEFDVDDGTISATGNREEIRWLYDYLQYLKRAWRNEGEQWDADAAEEMAESLYKQVGGDLPDRQRTKKAMTDGGSVESEAAIEQTFITLVALLKADDKAAVERQEDLLGDSKGQVIKCAGAIRDQLDDYPDAGDVDPEEVFG